MEEKKTYRMGKFLVLQVAANTTIEAGHMVAVNSSGYAVAASKAANLKAVGVADESVSTGAGETATVRVQRGTFLMKNGTDSDALALANTMGDCYFVDSLTVGTVATGSSKAGRVLGFEDGGVWVEMGAVSDADAFAGKADAADVYNKTAIDGLISDDGTTKMLFGKVVTIDGETGAVSLADPAE